MHVITIRRWKKKLVLLLVAAVFLVSLGLGISWYLTPEDNPAVAPSENSLQKDILTQPIKVQGQPAAQPAKNQSAPSTNQAQPQGTSK